MNRQNVILTANVVAQDTDSLYEVARSKGINMPHPSLGIFKSILCEIGKANANGVRLDKLATEIAVSTLIGCQINKNHGRTEVMGHVIDSSINNGDVEVVCIFFKDIYADDWSEAQELFEKNNLTVSFELSADVESQEHLKDGTKILKDFYFTGLGLLFGVKPACKRARVFELAAKKLQEKLSLERQSLIFANNQSSQKSIMEVLKQMADEVKKIEEAQKLCPECNEPMKDEECAVCKDKKMKAEEVKAEEPKTEEVKAEEPKAEEAKVEEPKAEEAKAEEAKVEEPKAEEAKVEEPKAEEAKVEEPKAEETKAEDKVTVVTETKQTVIDTMEPGKETVIVETETTRIVNDKIQEEQKVIQESVYTYAQVEEIKAGYEKQIAELKEQIIAKDNEVVTLKASVEKLAVKEVVVAEVKPDLSTGHKTVTASEVSQGSPLARALRSHKANKN